MWVEDMCLARFDVESPGYCKRANLKYHEADK